MEGKKGKAKKKGKEEKMEGIKEKEGKMEG